jgi:hypothetical protein
MRYSRSVGHILAANMKKPKSQSLKRAPLPWPIWLTTVFDEDCISISIRDSGYGIHAADIDKIFEPFFSTKNSDEGTRLGLSICMSIIKNHGGNLTVNSTPAQGSEFIITLPTGNQPPDVVSTASSVSSALDLQPFYFNRLSLYPARSRIQGL